jgi:3-methyladenine DNA glycosylase AlkC
MAKAFKDYYGTSTARLLAEKMAAVRPQFDVGGFVTFIRTGIRGKEFLARQDVYVEAFEEFLGDDYSKNVKLFTKILGPELETTDGMFTHGYWLWPVGRYVERHGLEDYDASIAFIYELTKRFTGEFAMRPLLEAYPKKTLVHVKRWSKDKNVHVRRLASECMRIKLPWAKKLDVALEHFDIYQTILTNLNSAPEKFVQKSVGNNLNDLMKVDPKKAQAIIKAWGKGNPSKETLWIVKHGTRILRKHRK